jgi:aerobic-type carbon monoxide dehydrogenase small subunit (CoxS/CutS family)
MQRCEWIEHDGSQCPALTAGLLCPKHAAKAEEADNDCAEISREMTRKFEGGKQQ